MNYLFGGSAAQNDHLSYFSFGNIQFGAWHYWVYAFVVWGVCIIVHHYVFRAQERFCREFRYKWLKTLPEPRASTIMVENIPSKYRSDEKLKQFFDNLLKKDAVFSAYVVRDTTELLAAEEVQNRIAFKLAE